VLQVISAKTGRRLSDLEIAATIGKAIADALEPGFARIENSLGGIEGGIGGVEGRLGGIEGRLGGIENTLGEVRDSLRDIRAIAIERHLDLDQRVRRIEQHLKLSE
jgi:hypothetical protein